MKRFMLLHYGFEKPTPEIMAAWGDTRAEGERWLARAAQIHPEIRTTVSKEDFQDYWKKVNESTSSAFSGIHFSHWILAVVR